MPQLRERLQAVSYLETGHDEYNVGEELDDQREQHRLHSKRTVVKTSHSSEDSDSDHSSSDCEIKEENGDSFVTAGRQDRASLKNCKETDDRNEPKENVRRSSTRLQKKVHKVVYYKEDADFLENDNFMQSPSRTCTAIGSKKVEADFSVFDFTKPVGTDHSVQSYSIRGRHLVHENPKVSPETVKESKAIFEDGKKHGSNHETTTGLTNDKISQGSSSAGGAQGSVVAERIGTIETILASKPYPGKETQYLVKIKDHSYREVVWVEESTILNQQWHLLQGYLKRHPGQSEACTEDEHFFPPEYTLVDRIIAEDGTGRKKQYFVKWRNLPYSNATWELASVLNTPADILAVERFHGFQLKSKSGVTGTSTDELSFNDGRQLRNYQQAGVAWMFHNFCKGVNCILADEMGLGKTLQSVAVLESLRIKGGSRGPFLIIAPVTTLGHWKREIESLDNMNCVVYSGNQVDREIIRDYEFPDFNRGARVTFNVLLTSFEMLLKDKNQLAKFKWKYCIVDEAHRLKSSSSKTTLSLKMLDIHRGGLLLLTGTPVQNNTKELFGLLNVLDSETFGSEEEFMAKFGDIRDPMQVKELQDNILRPRLLRRMKDDVEKSIPKKEEVIIWVELTQDQRLYYRAILEDKIGVLLKGGKAKNVPNLRNVAMELRKLCCHPFLCNGLIDDMVDKKLTGAPKDSMLPGTEKLQAQLLIESSGKMVLIDKLLPKLKEAGHRILIFSQFVIMLDLLEDYMKEKDYLYERIDGTIRGGDRQAAIDRFNAKDSNSFVFLLSTRAGGLGITLTSADTCIIYDSDWNPQNDLQAMARCHRIGQTKDVKIYRLITNKTYEQQLFHCSSRKYGLDEAILGNHLGAGRNPEQNIDIESLLKNGAYDILKEEGGEEAAAFSAANIDQILDQRTQTRAIGGSGNSTFSVASFDASGDQVGSKAICEDSASFWQKLLPTAATACELAKDSQEQLTEPVKGPRTRSRVNYKEVKFNDSEDDSQEEVEDTDKESIKKSVKDLSSEREARTKAEMDRWSRSEFKRLKETLLSIGEGRTEQVRKEANLEHRTLENVEEVVDAYIKMIQEMKLAAQETILQQNLSSSGTDKAQEGAMTIGQAREVCNKQQIVVESENVGKIKEERIRSQSTVKIPDCVSKLMESTQLRERMKIECHGFLAQLNERKLLAEAITAGLPQVNSKRWHDKLPAWWDAEADQQLLIGAHRHGHSAFTKIMEDEDLCFKGKFQQADVERIEVEKLLADNSITTAATEITPQQEAYLLTLKKKVDDCRKSCERPKDRVLKSLLRGLIALLPKIMSQGQSHPKASQLNKWLKSPEDSFHPILQPLEITECKITEKTFQMSGVPSQVNQQFQQLINAKDNIERKTSSTSGGLAKPKPKPRTQKKELSCVDNGSLVYASPTEDSIEDDEITVEDEATRRMAGNRQHDNNFSTKNFQESQEKIGVAGKRSRAVDDNNNTVEIFVQQLGNASSKHQKKQKQKLKQQEAPPTRKQKEKIQNQPLAQKRRKSDRPSSVKRQKAPDSRQGSLAAFLVRKEPL